MMTADQLLRGVSTLAILTDIESESCVAWKSLPVHTCQYRDLSVDVIVNLNGGFAIQWSQDSANVLDNSPSEGDRKGHKHRIERRTIEPFAEETAGRDKHQSPLLRRGVQIRHDFGASLLPHSALKDERGYSPRTKCRHH